MTDAAPTFCKAIAMRLEKTTGLHRGACEAEAADVLAMPEMESIRNLLLLWRDEAADPANPMYYRAWYDALPDSVKQWVLS
jgi:hypothetical protein